MKEQFNNIDSDIFINYVKNNIKNSEELIVFWIDLFCGAGGTTSGIHFSGIKNMFVAACVNHDTNAILSHQQNHPNTIHFIEDIRNFEVVQKLKTLVDKLRSEFPNCIINLWASLECTNFSKAKGGQTRDADSRTLAEHMQMYLEGLNPDYFWVENVREFMSWGPLDEKGKPVSRQSGQDYLRWIGEIKRLGYKFDYRILNAADFGSYQSRERLFLQFSKPEFPISWPEQTHSKKSTKDSLFPSKKWKAVKDMLDLDDEGQSIFTRKKTLCENTLKRIYAGLIKFVANGEDTFIKKYYSGRPAGKVASINNPAGTITTIDGQAIVTATHLNTYYGNSGLHSVNNPSPTLTTKDRIAKVDVNFLDQQYGNSEPISIESVCNILTVNPKFNLVNVKNFILNPSWGGHSTSVDNPSCTIIARQDKAPLYLISTETGGFSIPIYEDDSETMILIKKFMIEYGIIDIKMRMLDIQELKQIQGFPKDYKLMGTKTEQKKYIGNAVDVTQAKALVSNNYNSLVKKTK